MTPADWLARVRHDLLKPLLWPARDRREMGGAPAPRELVPALIDGEGRPVTAAASWAALRAEAPPALSRQALDAFDAALSRALSAADGGDVAGVLALEAEVDGLGRLVRNLEGG